MGERTHEKLASGKLPIGDFLGCSKRPIKCLIVMLPDQCVRQMPTTRAFLSPTGQTSEHGGVREDPLYFWGPSHTGVGQNVLGNLGNPQVPSIFPNPRISLEEGPAS